MRKSIKATAYHEAGHVVMNTIKRRAFRLATIDPERLADGVNGCVFGGTISEQRKENLRLVQKDIEIRFAGGIAEKIYTGRNNNVGARSDRHWAAELIIDHIPNPKRLDYFIQYLWLGVEDELKKPLNWASVEAIADYLLEHKTLHSRKARLIAREAKARYIKDKMESRKA